MRALFVAFLSVALCASAAYQKDHKKPPDVQILEAKVRRIEQKITLDGRLRATGEKPVQGLVIFFDFLSAEGQPLTSQRTGIDEEVLASGEEAAFHAETAAPPGAVKCRIRAFDEHERELRVANSGPFIIE
ncbi:MAG: hypothetical protein LAP87_07910 [Acidobacteriia bacterium]|nr:hypothetical protein [Terriglobia bacterium]